MQIAVTGHRHLGQLDLLRSGVNQIFHQLLELFPSQDWIFYSQLAEGSDRLVFQQAVEFAYHNPQLHIRLIAHLPLPLQEYQKDFMSPESKAEFKQILAVADEVLIPDQFSDRPICYHEANLRYLDRANILLALWDGLPARGLGGTADFVQMARSRSIPLAWVLAFDRYSSTPLNQFRFEDQGKVVKERWDTINPKS